MVEEIDFHVHTDFVQDIFDSCKDITIPGVGLALKAMCGKWGQHCNPERWFGFMGSGPPEGPAPFTINYKILDGNITIGRKTVTPLNEKITSCEKGVLVS